MSQAVQNNVSGQVVVTGYVETDTKSLSLDENVKNTKPADNEIKDFASVEVLPEFEGGMAGWSAYISKTFKYPAEARNNNISGRVIMSFVVLKDGSLTDIKVLRGIGGGADEEAVRILRESPKWKPGIQNGKPVMVAYTMPIFFQLSVEPADQKPEEKKIN